MAKRPVLTWEVYLNDVFIGQAQAVSEAQACNMVRFRHWGTRPADSLGTFRASSKAAALPKGTAILVAPQPHHRIETSQPDFLRGLVPAPDLYSQDFFGKHRHR